VRQSSRVIMYAGDTLKSDFGVVMQVLQTINFEIKKNLIFGPTVVNQYIIPILKDQIIQTLTKIVGVDKEINFSNVLIGLRNKLEIKYLESIVDKGIKDPDNVFKLQLACSDSSNSKFIRYLYELNDTIFIDEPNQQNKEDKENYEALCRIAATCVSILKDHPITGINTLSVQGRAKRKR
jgi:hypothetical protein